MRIYADNAATSHPKAPGVAEAIATRATSLFSPGRGAYRESIEAAALISRTRARLANLIGAPSNTSPSSSAADQIVFTAGTTDSLNLAIKGVVRAALHNITRSAPSSQSASQPPRRLHIVASSIDHNAVLRPLNSLVTQLANQGGPALTFTLIPPVDYTIDLAALAAALTPDTCLVILNAVSNVTGAIQPIAEISKLCRDIPLLIDAAQLLGHVPFNLAQHISKDRLPHTLVAISAHKGLLGPPGIGALYFGPGMEHRCDPWREGGTGNQSELPHQPTTMPARFEAGTPNLLGIAGWDAALAFLAQRGIDTIRHHEQNLCARFLAAFTSDPRLQEFTLHGPRDPAARTPIFSISHPLHSPSLLAATLESACGLLTRAGLACAPLALDPQGQSQGAVRISFGYSTSFAEVDQAIEALAATNHLLTPSSDATFAAR